jgi:hypothetical protein
MLSLAGKFESKRWTPDQRRTIESALVAEKYLATASPMPLPLPHPLGKCPP